MKALIGLGNPGRQYEQTPHNVGFAVVDSVASRLTVSLKRSWRFQARMGKALLPDGQPVWLVEPQTYMNSSGKAVAAILRYHGIAPADAVVVMDDADLPMGRMRIRAGGRSGGHRGLDSVIECLGTADVPRLRVGIGRERATAGLVAHVLSPFSTEERAWVARVVDQAADAVLTVLLSGAEVAMNRFNGVIIPVETPEGTKTREGRDKTTGETEH